MNDQYDAPGQETMVEELVAYLDGELDTDSNRRVERRLSQDPKYRRQLRALQQSWDLLDHLPRADVDESFTESTIAMVALRASDERQQTQTSATRRFRLVMGGAAACAALAFASAFAATRWWADMQDRQLLSDLPVIENLDEYRYAESIEFLRLLEREGLFSEGGLDHEL
jgi:anti-sigma factor RsiW